VPSVLYFRVVRELLFKIWAGLVINIALSIIGYCVILNVVPKLKDMFVKAHLSGVDLNKKNKPEM
jgi:hypothetical protein